MRSLMPATADLPCPGSLPVAAHKADERHWRAVSRLVVPVRTRGDRHIQFTCRSCGQRPHLLMEGGVRPGQEITAGCSECGAVNECRVRRAMFA